MSNNLYFSFCHTPEIEKTQIQKIKMYAKVKQFTEESSSQPLPTKPQAFNRREVEFLVSMVCSEMNELLQTVCVDMEDCRRTMERCITVDVKSQIQKPASLREQINDQADSLTDAIYYILNAASKKCIDLDATFEEVHTANMNKKDRTTGKFIKRADGKIVKPYGWVPPCIGRALFPPQPEELEQENAIPIKSGSGEVQWVDFAGEFESSEPSRFPPMEISALIPEHDEKSSLLPDCDEVAVSFEFANGKSILLEPTELSVVRRNKAFFQEATAMTVQDYHSVPRMQLLDLLEEAKEGERFYCKTVELVLVDGRHIHITESEDFIKNFDYYMSWVKEVILNTRDQCMGSKNFI